MRDGKTKINESSDFSFRNFCTRTTDTLCPVIGGYVAFGATLALSTLAQKAIGVSTATPVLPSLLGFATVCAASLVSEKTAIFAHELKWAPKKGSLGYIRRKFEDKISETSSDIKSSTKLRMGRKRNFKLPMHEVRVCLVGLLAFKSLGGRFWAISPSSFTHLGSFARWSIPCKESYATPKQRVMIEQMGRKWGCHTCGSKMYLKSAKSSTGKTYRFVGDHMPPKSVAKHMNEMWVRRVGLLPPVQFRFFPQCVSCSNSQGSILSKAGSKLGGLSSSMQRMMSLKEAGGGRTAHFHGFRPRINHAAGGVLAATITLGASERDVAYGKRLERWHRRIKNAIKCFQ